MREFNEVRPHWEKWCFGKTPLQSDAGTETNNSARPRMAVAAKAAIGINTYILL
jgi:hypothetical protein